MRDWKILHFVQDDKTQDDKTFDDKTQGDETIRDNTLDNRSLCFRIILYLLIRIATGSSRTVHRGHSRRCVDGSRPGGN